MDNQITGETLATWNACADGLKWFLTQFPQGAAYGDVQAALRAEYLHEWSGWLTNAVFAAAIKEPARIASLVKDEVAIAVAETVGSPNSASGDGSTAASSGYGSTAASSGDGSKAASSGKHTIAMVAGRTGRAKAGPLGCIALVWWDGERNRIVAAHVGENGIKADTWYRLDDAGQFVECE